MRSSVSSILTRGDLLPPSRSRQRYKLNCKSRPNNKQNEKGRGQKQLSHPSRAARASSRNRATPVTTLSSNLSKHVRPCHTCLVNHITPLMQMHASSNPVQLHSTALPLRPLRHLVLGRAPMTWKLSNLVWLNWRPLCQAQVEAPEALSPSTADLRLEIRLPSSRLISPIKPISLPACPLLSECLGHLALRRTLSTLGSPMRRKILHDLRLCDQLPISLVLPPIHRRLRHHQRAVVRLSTHIRDTWKLQQTSQSNRLRSISGCHPLKCQHPNIEASLNSLISLGPSSTLTQRTLRWSWKA